MPNSNLNAMSVIGRKSEIEILKRLLNSNSPEFLAVYGRRRIGKTYLISQFFSSQKDCLFFQSVGIRNGKLTDQLKQFSKEIGRVFYPGAELRPKDNWMDLFDQLQQAISNIADSNPSQKIVLFLDELPWMATPKSGLLESLEHFWNRHGSQNPQIILIICGSSASWILENIINNKEGLYNRVTQPLKLSPLTLHETEEYLKAKGFSYPKKQIMEVYLALGGIPFYLNLLNPKQSVPQNLDTIFFRPAAPLLSEFTKLFASLFNHSECHEQIIRAIAKHTYGIEMKELANQLKFSIGGRLNKRLQELEDAGFIIKLMPYGAQSRGAFYRVIDPFSLFHLRFIEPFQASLRKLDQGEGYWPMIQSSQSFKTWRGYAFETLCLQHLQAIRKALKITPDASIHTWRYAEKNGGAQIDLIFDRSDDVVQICEIKCSDKPFTITKLYHQQLRNKLALFQKQAAKIHRNQHKIYFLSLISASGLTPNLYSEELVNSTVSLDDLFLT